MDRALVVIDIQNDYFPGGTFPLHQAEKVEGQIATAIAKAKAAGDRVILVRHVSNAKTGLFAPDRGGIAIRPAILAASGDTPVVTKHFADAFQETNLEQYLDGVSTLMICGMMTQNCVVFTAMSQNARNFETRVVSNLCAAPSDPIHRIALNALGSKLTLSQAEELWPLSV